MAGSNKLDFSSNSSAAEEKLHDKMASKNYQTPTTTKTTTLSSNIIEHLLPPENDMGNIEYKSQLINPSLSRLQHLSTQMKWRLCEGDGEAIYEIGVNDDGTFTGLTEKQMEDSLQTIQSMASCINAVVTILNKRVIYNVGCGTEPKYSIELLIRKLPDSNLKANLRIAIIGNAQSGKSTLCGVLTQGKLDNGNGQARISIFRHLHEFRSGKTSSICFDLIGFTKDGQLLNYKEHSLDELLERSSKLVTLIDLAGDRKFLKTTIYGVSGYNPHYCALTINARIPITAITREHYGLAMALGIPIFIVVTKIDVINEAQLERILEFVEKRLVGCTEYSFQRITNKEDAESSALSMPSSSEIPVFCISNVTGQNLDILSHFLAHLPQLDCLPLLKNVESQKQQQQRCSSHLPTAAEELPLFYIEEIFRSEKVGTIICGLLAEGNMAEGDRVKFGPNSRGEYCTATIESIHRNKQPVLRIVAGDSASIVLQGPSNDYLNATLRRGMVVINEFSDEMFSWKFKARFYLLQHFGELFIGFQGTIYIGSLRRTVTIVDFDEASITECKWYRGVTFKFVQQPEYVRVGMPLIFRERTTKAYGIIDETVSL